MSNESVKASLDKMQAGMSDEEKAAFAKDCTTIALKDAIWDAAKDLFSGTKAKDADPSALAEFSKPLQGMTVAEIRAKAKEIRETPPAKK